MITVTEYQGRQVGIFGLGKAGEAAVASLLAGGASVWAWDDNAAGVEKIAAHYGDEVMLQPPEAWPWQEMAALVLSPGVPLTHPKPHPVVRLAASHNCPIIGDIELLQRACPDATYIGITGTNGKSTTTTLIGHIIGTTDVPVEVGGNLGTPALALEPLDEGGVYVLELSSYQLDLVRTTRFNVAVWLNISPDHIDRHGSIKGYIEAKEAIFERQRVDDKAIISIDDGFSQTTAEKVRRAKTQRVIDISVRRKAPGGVYVDNGLLFDATDSAMRRFDLATIPTLPGRHNWQNAAAAYAACCAVGIDPRNVYAGMQSFAGLKHRSQLVAAIDGVRFVNDSKATNADATSHALSSYDTIYWIAGGKAKEGGIVSLEEYFPRIAHAFLIGEAESEFAATLKGKVSYTRCGTLQAATEKAAEMAFAEQKPGAVVLLSPACASFDQWRNFEERGDAFCKIVEKIERANAA